MSWISARDLPPAGEKGSDVRPASFGARSERLHLAPRRTGTPVAQFGYISASPALPASPLQIVWKLLRAFGPRKTVAQRPRAVRALPICLSLFAHSMRAALGDPRR